MAHGAERCTGDLPPDMVSLSRAQLESGGEPIFARAAAEFRHRSYFWALRFSRPGRGRGMPAARRAVRGRADRHVFADCAQPAVEADVSWHLGPQDAAGGP